MPNNEEEIKKITIDGTSTEPFACPYCKKKITTEDTADPRCNWETVSFPDWGETNRMNCPHCGKRIELHQTC